jgi:chitodextrinase
MKPLRLVTRYRPAVLTALAALGLAAIGVAGSAPASLAAVQAPQARILNPSPPTGLTAVAGDGKVSLSWTPPTSNGGAAIIGYDVFQGGGAASGLVGGTSYTVTGLTNGTTYSFTVDAVNDAELHSAPSSPASATPVAPVTAPGAPSGLTAAAGDAQVSLSWQPPSSDGGAAITSYNVYQGGKKTATVSGTGATVKNLSNGTAYSFTVTAVNKAGEGPASGSASATPTGGSASASASASASGSASASASASASGSASASASGSASASASGSASSSGSATPTAGAGASGTPAGSAGPASTSGQPAGAAVLASETKKMPKPVLFTLAALALAAAAGVLTLTTRRVRKVRRTKRPPAAPPVDVRAVPEIGPPSPVSVREFSVEKHELGVENHEVVMEETYTVRLEPLPAEIITTFEEISA